MKILCGQLKYTWNIKNLPCFYTGTTEKDVTSVKILLTSCYKSEASMFKQKRQDFEILSVILQNCLSKHTQEGSSKLLPLNVALNQALDLFFQ